MNELLVGMGQRIASARRAKNLTQEQLAELSGVSYQTILIILICSIQMTTIIPVTLHTRELPVNITKHTFVSGPVRMAMEILVITGQARRKQPDYL